MATGVDVDVDADVDPESAGHARPSALNGWKPNHIERPPEYCCLPPLALADRPALKSRLRADAGPVPAPRATRVGLPITGRALASPFQGSLQLGHPRAFEDFVKPRSEIVELRRPGQAGHRCRLQDRPRPMRLRLAGRLLLSVPSL